MRLRQRMTRTTSPAGAVQSRNRAGRTPAIVLSATRRGSNDSPARAAAGRTASTIDVDASLPSGSVHA